MSDKPLKFETGDLQTDISMTSWGAVHIESTVLGSFNINEENLVSAISNLEDQELDSYQLEIYRKALIFLRLNKHQEEP